MKVALYARVSTDMQDPLMQRRALEEKAKREGWEHVYYEEVESTRKTRPVKYGLYQELLDKKYDAVCVWKLDRWARSTQEASREIETLFTRGVSFISLTESIDLSTAAGRLQFNVISAFAQFERDLIRERTKEAFYVDDEGVTRSKRTDKAVGKRGKDDSPRKKGGYYLRYSKQTPPRKNDVARKE